MGGVYEDWGIVNESRRVEGGGLSGENSWIASNGMCDREC